jgi:hypothetical protein
LARSCAGRAGAKEKDRDAETGAVRAASIFAWF